MVDKPLRIVHTGLHGNRVTSVMGGMVLGRHIEEMFDRYVPEDFQQNTLRLLISAYERSRDEVRSRYDFPENKYLWGHERRAMFDRDWRLLAEEYRERGLTATIESNRPENFHFTRINAGRVIITAAHVPEYSQLVRHADFRQTYARTSQRSLFGGEEPTEDEPLFALLIHSAGSIEDTPFPKFADFVFPEPRQKCYAHRIRLFERFYALVPEIPQGEIVPDTLQPEIAIRMPKKGDVSA